MACVAAAVPWSSRERPAQSSSGQVGLHRPVLHGGGGSLGGLVVSVLVWKLTGRRFESASRLNINLTSPVVHDWVNKGLGISSRVCVTR